eukprot:511423-Amphidinium_carterae.1
MGLWPAGNQWPSCGDIWKSPVPSRLEVAGTMKPSLALSLQSYAGLDPRPSSVGGSHSPHPHYGP